MELRRSISQASPLCLIALALLSLLWAPRVLADDSVKTLVIYNWEDYLPEEVRQGFEQKYGYKIKEVYYETDDLKNELLAETNGAGMDLMIGSAHSFKIYLKRKGLLAPLSPATQTELARHMDPMWAAQFPELVKVAAPYAWGTMGIVYRRDLVSHEITSWRQLMTPVESLRGKIMMINDYRDSMSAALLLLGYSVNEQRLEAITEAGEVLQQQRPYVKKYGYLDVGEQSELITGEIWMALAYNGDALLLKSYLDAVEYVVPSEGTNLWADYIAVLESSSQKAAAMQFIEYIHQPEIAAKIALALNYATPNKAAKKFLPSEHLSDPLIYPSADVLAKCQFHHPLEGNATRRYNNTFLNIVNQ